MKRLVRFTSRGCLSVLWKRILKTIREQLITEYVKLMETVKLRALLYRRKLIRWLKAGYLSTHSHLETYQSSSISIKDMKVLDCLLETVASKLQKKDTKSFMKLLSRTIILQSKRRKRAHPMRQESLRAGLLKLITLRVKQKRDLNLPLDLERPWHLVFRFTQYNHSNKLKYNRRIWSKKL